jgi:acetyl/propionyl-CoA carboxylase alpha subunit
MRLLGDKISAKRLAERLGIPVIPWTGQAAPNLDAARAHARELGYPVVIKAAAGEGGRCAEDAEAGFAAAPGTLSLFRMPTRTGLRLDSGAAEGDAIPAEYDSMFAKLISCAASRREALAGLSVHRALQVGSLDRIIPAAELRPYLIDAIRRGMERELDRWQKASYELH